MSAPVVLVNPSVLAGATVGSVVEVDGAEGHHAVDVRRMRAGDPVHLVDGLGTRAIGEVADSAGQRGLLRVRVMGIEVEALPVPRIIAVQAIPKGERAELAVAMLTEVGVDVIVPWAAQRCIAVWREGKAERGHERWTATARESAKQSRRARVPEILPLMRTPAVCDLIRTSALSLLLHEESAQPISSVAVPVAGDIIVIIGPEGGIDEQEQQSFVAAGAQSVRLGPSVLRSSTAGTVACGILLAGSGRWMGGSARD